MCFFRFLSDCFRVSCSFYRHKAFSHSFFIFSLFWSSMVRNQNTVRTICCCSYSSCSSLIPVLCVHSLLLTLTYLTFQLHRNIMSSATLPLLARGMKKQFPMFQSAIATLIFFSTSSGAFLSTSTGSKCYTCSRILSRSLVTSTPSPPAFAFTFTSASTSAQYTRTKTTYSKTARMTATSEDTKNLLLDERGSPTTVSSNDQQGLLLPYRDGSHGSAKIILSEDETGLYDKDMNSTTGTTLSIEEFRHNLHATIAACTELNKKSLWIQIPMSQARYIEACTNIPGLNFHHTEGDTVHLALWLRQDIENKIPEYATHQVGVGAIVINSRDEILCVRELRKNFRKWKIPGGLADLGEQLDEAAIREVKEETGIDCTFKNVLGFRHTHGLQFGRSDMYFVCELEPIEDDGGLQQPVAQEGEIAATAWVPLLEYKEMINGKGEDKNPHPMMQKMMGLHDQQSDIQRTVMNSIVPGRKPSPIYHAPETK